MKVLFSTDGSKGSFEAERCLTAIGDRDSIDVTVLAVGDASGRVMSASADPTRGSRWGAWTVADAGRSRVEKEGFSATSLATIGSPREEIARQARDGGYDLTLLGARDHQRRRATISTIGALVLSDSRSAVFISKARPRGHVRALLIEDDSPGAAAAISCFGNFADARRCSTTSLSLRGAPVQPAPIRVGSGHRDASSEGAAIDSLGSSIDLVRSGYFGVVVCGVRLEAGAITADPVLDALLREAPSLLIACS
jgi:nucleotide-binding universal stress UspA family protein